MMGIAMGAMVGTQALRAVATYSDTWTNVESSLKLVTSSTQELAEVQKDLFKVAEGSRQSYEATATLYARMARATKDLAYENKDLLQVTETINKALVVSGASAAESSSTITQLSQAMASGVLRGEEYNSISENGARINEIFAKSLGVTNGELRKMASEGKITTEVMMKALLEETQNVNAEFEKMDLTIGQALTSFDNNVGKSIDNIGFLGTAMDNLATSTVWLGKTLEETTSYWFGHAEAIDQTNLYSKEYYETQKKIILGLDTEKVSADGLLSIIQDLADEEAWLAKATEETAWKAQELADDEAQLAQELNAVNGQVEESIQLLTQETQVKQDATVATQELAQATSWLYDAQGNLRDSDTDSDSSSGTYSVFTPNVGIINSFNSALVQSSNIVDSFNTTVNEVDNSLAELENALSSISQGLSTNYSSQARESLFGGTSNALSFEQAKASAQEAWNLFQTDNFNEDFLKTYNDRMSELIGTLDEFKDSSNYNSKAEQTFAQHLALRQIKGFDDAQLDTKAEVDSQIEALNAIKSATESTRNYTKGNLDQSETKGKIKSSRETTNVTGTTSVQMAGQTFWFPVHSNSVDYKYYKDGGYTGNMGVNDEAGIVHGQEYVVNAQTTKDLGLNGQGGTFEAMRSELAAIRANLYEINKSTKRSLSIERQSLDVQIKAS